MIRGAGNPVWFDLRTDTVMIEHSYRPCPDPRPDSLWVLLSNLEIPIAVDYHAIMLPRHLPLFGLTRWTVELMARRKHCTVVLDYDFLGTGWHVDPLCTSTLAGEQAVTAFDADTNLVEMRALRNTCATHHHLGSFIYGTLKQLGPILLWRKSHFASTLRTHWPKMNGAITLDLLARVSGCTRLQNCRA